MSPDPEYPRLAWLESIGVKRVAALLHVSERTVLRMIRSGRLPGFMVENQWRVQVIDLRAYIKRGKDLAPGQDGTGMES